MNKSQPFNLVYCKKCLQNNLRPYIHFHDDGVCAPCKNRERELKEIDWDERWKQLEKLADKYRGCNGNGWDCAIAASSGKDSTTIISIIKDRLKLNPVILSLGNIGWTDTGRKNFDNISDSFGVDVIMKQPNIDLHRRLSKKTFIEQGKPTSAWDIEAYAYVHKMAHKIGTKLVFWGENISWSYGGVDAEETPSGRMMSENKVVTPEFEKWVNDGVCTEKEIDPLRMMSPAEIDASGLEPVYLQWYIGWSSHRNALIAKRNGFLTLEHEHIRSSTIESYNQIDSLPYLTNQALKYQRFGFASATEMASRWIRDGIKTREEMISVVKEKDGQLDQEVARQYMDFVGMKPKEFYGVLDKWYNPNLFYQDSFGLWHEKFDVGVGMKPEFK